MAVDIRDKSPNTTEQLRVAMQQVYLGYLEAC